MDLNQAEQGAFTGQRHPWEIARRRIVRDLFGQTSVAHGVLDVGCGDAYVLDGLARWGLATAFWGVDSALPEPRQYAVRDVAVELVQDLNEMKAPRDAVTHVTLLDVLEHVEDDTGLLRAIAEHAAVRADAYYIITVPAHQLLFTEHDRLLHHYRRYAKPQLVAAVQAAGLDVVACGGLFTSLLFPRALSRLVEAARGPRGESTQVAGWSAPQLVTEAITKALIADYKVGARLRRRGTDVPGLSLYLIARGRRG